MVNDLESDRFASFDDGPGDARLLRSATSFVPTRPTPPHVRSCRDPQPQPQRPDHRV